MTNTQLIRTIASSVRAWAEACAAGSYMEEDLGGMCAIASVELWNRLSASGIKSQFRVYTEYSGGCHVYLAVDDHVLDITATQFNEFKRTKILYMHERALQHCRYYTHTHTFDHPRDLVAWQKETNFSEEQIPIVF